MLRGFVFFGDGCSYCFDDGGGIDGHGMKVFEWRSSKCTHNVVFQSPSNHPFRSSGSRTKSYHIISF